MFCFALESKPAYTSHHSSSHRLSACDSSFYHACSLIPIIQASPGEQPTTNPVSSYPPLPGSVPTTKNTNANAQTNSPQQDQLAIRAQARITKKQK
ncbi:hypothetical protein VNO80_06164 [Phaseolus coccineus]|uniref:Uncharacterized protein n=1 Tax=Phaseolus coccineus TaxID=3886 RepID=A0AAN9NHL0_PHACN